MNFVIDIVIVAIILISAILAAKKGFIGTVFTLVSTILAIVLSIALSTPVSKFVDETFVNPTVKNYIVSVIDSSSVGKSYEEAINSIDVAGMVKSMPESLKKVLEMSNIDVSEIVEKAENTVSDTAAAKDELINSIAAPISGTISTVASLLGLFVVLSIALWFVAKLLTAIVKLIPFGKSLNLYGGFALGAVRGLIIAFVISVFFVAMSKTTKPESSSLFSQKTIDSTVVLKTISEINPVGLILNVK